MATRLLASRRAARQARYNQEEVMMPHDVQGRVQDASRRGMCAMAAFRRKRSPRVTRPKTALRKGMHGIGLGIWVSLASTVYAQTWEISDYKPIKQVVTDTNHYRYVAIRQFEKTGVSSYLLVDPQTLKTSIQPAAHFEIAKNQDDVLRTSNYARALAQTTAPPFPIQNQGLTHAFHSAPHVAYLTIDMCPSSHAFNKDFYERLIALGARHHLPMTIDVSGLWIVRHGEEYSWLKKAIAAGQLHVTWVNHAYLHRYLRDAPLERNFLLIPGTDVDSEILEVKKLLIADNQTPSIFFRYPGLVSDSYVATRTRELGVIPLGADAWLAKGQPIRDGSIVLVHANGNEPAGLKLLTNDVLAAHRWRPLNEAITYDPGHSSQDAGFASRTVKASSE
ncbi:hypothetical protein N5W20_07615 [Candidatus Kirkpatrickella diaphorinae]|uniref:Polysaccharide deacetylase n=1 Tax=Candidatus Kirkpatrickella diaphorinae TaxID=2984322 RepID=A0ABY6GJW4_9PROT|nr:hypothetical protein [Candidatus Kirkpatrickella diaphorinae]UYH50956.1 hypothetical protein N5W20_07615 [Candidatus Kirkpatrickella diaphorinae]